MVEQVTNLHDATTTDTCPDCGNDDFFVDATRGETICKGCGIVVFDRAIDTGAEWTAFDRESENKKSRVGLPRTDLHAREGLATIIGSGNFLATAGQSASARRLQRTHQRHAYTTTKERNMSKALPKINSICSILGFSKAIEIASARIYRKAVEMRVSSGRSMEVLVYASVYLASKVAKRPKPIEFYERIEGISRKDIHKTERKIREVCNVNVPLSDPREFIEEIAQISRIPLTQKVRAYNILNDVANRVPKVRIPCGLAASVLFFVCKGERMRIEQEIQVFQNQLTVLKNRDHPDETKIHDIKKRIVDLQTLKPFQTQRDIAVASGLRETTIRKGYKEIRLLLERRAKKQNIKNLPITDVVSNPVKKVLKKYRTIDWKNEEFLKIFESSKSMYAMFLRQKIMGENINIANKMLDYFREELPKNGITSTSITMGSIYGLMKSDPNRIGYYKEGIPTFSYWKSKGVNAFEDHCNKLDIPCVM